MSFSARELQIRANGVVYTVTPHSGHTDFRATVNSTGDQVENTYLLGYLFEVVKGMNLAERMYARDLPASTAQSVQESIGALAHLYAVEGTANTFTAATGALVGGWASGGTVAIGVKGQLFGLGLEALRGSAAIAEPTIYLTMARALFEATNPIYRSLETAPVIEARQVEQLVDSLMVQHQLNLRIGDIISNDALLDRGMLGDALNFTKTLFSGFIGVFGQTATYLNAAPFAGSLLRSTELFEDVASILEAATSFNQIMSALYGRQSLAQYRYFSPEKIASARDLFDGIVPEPAAHVTATWGDTAVTVVTQPGGSFAATQQKNIVFSEGGGAQIDLSAAPGTNDIWLVTDFLHASSVTGGAGFDHVTLVHGQGSLGFLRADGAVLHASASFDDIEAAASAPDGLTAILSGGTLFGLASSQITLQGIDQISYQGGTGWDLFITLGADPARITGNAGGNTLYADWRGQTVDLTWDLHTTEEDAATLANGWTVQGIHRLLARLGDGDNHITLNDGDNVIFGGAGNDTIVGGAGNDALYGGDGNDFMIGGNGNDHLFGGDGNDTLVGGGGNDQIDGGAGRNVAVFSGVHADYQMNGDLSGGPFTITDLRGIDDNDGINTLVNIQILRFADGDVVLVPASEPPADVAILQGVISSRPSVALENVLVTFTSDEQLFSARSDAVGGFGFEIGIGLSGHLDASYAYDPATHGGITARDALDVLRLAVGLAPSWGPASPLTFVAADMNEDGQVTASDALDVLRAAVGLQSAHQPRWVFLDAEADLSGISHANTHVDKGALIDPLLAGLTEIALTGVLLGSMQEYV